MKELNLDEIQEGIIVQEVNCQGKFKTALNREIKDVFPEVFDSYKDYLAERNKYLVLGNVLFTEINDKLTVASIFGQFYYLTDLNKDEHEANLIENALIAIRNFANVVETPLNEVYVPERLGCDLGVYESWDNLSKVVKDLGLTEVKHDPSGWEF